MTVRQGPLSPCAEQVRRHDPDRYLCALFAPAARREALFALYAFNGEVARTREQVSEPMLGLIRLQWWRDAVAAIYDGKPPKHDVAQALSAAVAAGGLERAEIDRLIDSREGDLDDDPPADLAALEDYAEATSATLVRLAVGVLGGGAGARQAARHVGIAWALNGLLRAVPFHAGAGRLYLPVDLLTAAGITPGALFVGQPPAGLSVVAEQVADVARAHLDAARALRGEVPRTTLAALLPATLAARDLARLERVRHDVFDPSLAVSGLGRKLRVVFAAATGRY
jgi:phytoene synthase